MFTILLSLLACGEEKVDDSAQPVEEQQEQEDVPVEDPGEHRKILLLLNDGMVL